jgi:hypothetical protein
VTDGQVFKLVQTAYGRQRLINEIGRDFDAEINRNRDRHGLPVAPRNPRVRHSDYTYLHYAYSETTIFQTCRLGDPKAWGDFFRSAFPALLTKLKRDDEHMLKGIALQPWEFVLKTGDAGEGLGRCVTFSGCLFYAYRRHHPQDTSLGHHQVRNSNA